MMCARQNEVGCRTRDKHINWGGGMVSSVALSVSWS